MSAPTTMRVFIPLIIRKRRTEFQIFTQSTVEETSVLAQPPYITPDIRRIDVAHLYIVYQHRSADRLHQP